MKYLVDAFDITNESMVRLYIRAPLLVEITRGFEYLVLEMRLQIVELMIPTMESTDRKF